MNIAFTICSNNYLAHAKTLGDSFLSHHPNAKFVIGLVDKYNPDFDYSFFSAFEIILVEDISVPNFENLNKKYNITELNTAVKTTFLHYIFQKYNAKKVLYIDPDIIVTSALDEVFDLLDSKNILITPHMCSPIDDGFSPTDYHVLGGGVYNLGFIGLSDYESVSPFIDWWHDRVVKYGYRNYCQGMFYDQLWIHYVPCFFDNFYILKHLGYNMANWNLHERIITSQDQGEYLINNTFSLRFFHFSGYKHEKPNEICGAYHTRYNFDTRPDLASIFSLYNEKLLENRVLQISKLKVFYYPKLSESNKEITHKSILLKLFIRIKQSIKILIKGRL